ncbi:MAG: apolipoprotein N-acyltransferase [Planctomycetes bacterium]|nr:apolipoprotein N-acyltransferase [Planctomycetota bacterium]
MFVRRFWWGLLPSAGGLLMYLSFHPADLGFLAWFALIPLIVFAMRERRIGSVAAWSWLGGCVFFVPGLLWLRHTAGFGLVAVAAYFGLYWAAFAVGVRGLCRQARFPLPLAAPILWVALEFLRGHLFGGLPWFLVAYTQHEAWLLIQVVDLAGPWTLSFLLVFVNASVARALLAEEARRRWLVASGALVGLSFVYGAIRWETVERVEGPKVGIVQPNIPQDWKNRTRFDVEEAERIFEKHERLTRRLVEAEPDVRLILWPETVILQALLFDRDRGEWIQDRFEYPLITGPARETQKPMLIGTQVTEVSRAGTVEFTNSAVLIDPSGTIVGRYDKNHLVQFSEYLPFKSVLPTGKILKWVTGLDFYEFRAGREFPVFEAGGLRFAATVCAEAIFPEISREIARKDVPLIVNISNDGWFRDSAELDHMLVMARFRAIENRVHYIRATNTGISAFIEPTGEIQKKLEGPDGKVKEVEGILAADVRMSSGGSPYRAIGDALAWGCAGAAVAGAGLVALRLVDRKNRRS